MAGERPRHRCLSANCTDVPLFYAVNGADDRTSDLSRQVPRRYQRYVAAAPAVQLMRSAKNSASGDPAGYSWLLVSHAHRYASGTRTTTVVNIEIHMDGMVSPAPRMMPPKT